MPLVETEGSAQSVAEVVDRIVKDEIARAGKDGRELTYIEALEKVKHERPALMARYAQPARGARDQPKYLKG